MAASADGTDRTIDPSRTAQLAPDDWWGEEDDFGIGAPGRWRLNPFLTFAISIVLNAGSGWFGRWPIIASFTLVEVVGAELGLHPPMYDDPDMTVGLMIFAATAVWTVFLTYLLLVNWVLQQSSTVRARVYWPMAMGVAVCAALVWLRLLELGI